MELYIQIRDGQPFEHPIFGDNFREAYPHIDVNNLPPEFARFERIANTARVGTFEIAECSYQWVDGIVKDVWTVRQMTVEEEAQKRKDLAERAQSIVEFLRKGAQQNADSAPSDAAKQAWLDYLEMLNAWVLVDPISPKIPQPPRIGSDGIVLTTAAPGSVPNVIG